MESLAWSIIDNITAVHKKLHLEPPQRKYCRLLKMFRIHVLNRRNVYLQLSLQALENKYEHSVFDLDNLCAKKVLAPSKCPIMYLARKNVHYPALSTINVLKNSLSKNKYKARN